MAIRSWLKRRVAVRSRFTRQRVPATPRLGRLPLRAPSRLAPGLASWGRTTAMAASLPPALSSVDSGPSLIRDHQRLDHSDQRWLAAALDPWRSRVVLDSPGIRTYYYEQNQTVLGWQSLPHHPSLFPVCLLNNGGQPDDICSSWRHWRDGRGGADRTSCFSGHQSISSQEWTPRLDVEYRPGQQCEATRSCHASSKHPVPPTARRGSLGRPRKTTGGQLDMGGREYWRNQRSKRQWSAGSASGHDERTATR